MEGRLWLEFEANASAQPAPGHGQARNVLVGGVEKVGPFQEKAESAQRPGDFSVEENRPDRADPLCIGEMKSGLVGGSRPESQGAAGLDSGKPESVFELG